MTPDSQRCHTSRDFVGAPEYLVESLEDLPREIKRTLPPLALGGALLGCVAWLIWALIHADGSILWATLLPYCAVMLVCNAIECHRGLTRIRKARLAEKRALYGMHLIASEEPLSLRQAVPRLKRISQTLGPPGEEAEIARDILDKIECASMEHRDLPVPHVPVTDVLDELPRPA